MPREFVEPREMLLRRHVRVVRMDAHRRVDPVVLLGERNRGVQALRRRAAAPDREQRCHARGARAFEHRRAILVELRHLQVRV